MRAYQNGTRFQANIKQIARVDASLARILENVRPGSRLVIDDQGGFNVDLGGGQYFYPQDSRTAAEQQVSQYLQEPLRFQLAPGDVLEDCIELNRLYRDLRQGLAETPMATSPGPFGGFVVVFGIGLGQHVRLLAERLRFKTMILIEPHDELLVHSLHSMDWQSLIKDLARDGREVKFVRGDNAFVQVIKIIRGANYPLLDGSYFFIHYQAPEITALAQQLLNQCRAMSMASGWIEDQLTMMRNNMANYARPGFWLQEHQIGSTRKIPAFVIGAGPSLDSQIETIRRCRESVILITASSALKVMLDHGITPDIHCELENGAGLGLVAEDLASRFDLSGVTLYATPTVDPRIAPNFKQVVYFYRGHVSSTVLYADGAEATSFAEPTSGNTAVYCALSLGFRDIYLFGLDFGARDTQQHHSKHSVYFTYQDESELATYTPYEFNIPVPGNFGGQVMTGWMLDWGRTSVTNAIKGVDGVRVMNCSDGAQIQLTRPMVADELHIPLPPPDRSREQELERAFEGLTLCEHDRSRPDDVERVVEAVTGFLLAAVAELTEVLPENRSPQDCVLAPYGRIISRLSGLEAGDSVAQSAYRILAGHIQGGLSAGYHYASRLEAETAKGGLEVIASSLAESFQRLELLTAEALNGSGA